jgi:hypothetical protein
MCTGQLKMMQYPKILQVAEDDDKETDEMDNFSLARAKDARSQSQLAQGLAHQPKRGE